MELDFPQKYTNLFVKLYRHISEEMIEKSSGIPDELNEIVSSNNDISISNFFHPVYRNLSKMFTEKWIFNYFINSNISTMMNYLRNNTAYSTVGKYLDGQESVFEVYADYQKMYSSMFAAEDNYRFMIAGRCFKVGAENTSATPLMPNYKVYNIVPIVNNPNNEFSIYRSYIPTNFISKLRILFSDDIDDGSVTAYLKCNVMEPNKTLLNNKYFQLSSSMENGQIIFKDSYGNVITREIYGNYYVKEIAPYNNEFNEMSYVTGFIAIELPDSINILENDVLIYSNTINIFDRYLYNVPFIS